MPRDERARGGRIHPWIRQGPRQELRRRPVDAADRRIVLADTGVDHDHDERVGGLLGEDADVVACPIRHAAVQRRDPEVGLEPARVAAVVLQRAAAVGGIGVIPLMVARHGQDVGAGRADRLAPGRVERRVVIRAPGLILRIAEEQRGGQTIPDPAVTSAAVVAW